MRSSADTKSFRRQVMALSGRTIRYALVCAGVSYVLSFPVIGLGIVMEQHQPDELCIDTDPSAAGIWLEENGKQVCKFLARRILLFWSMAAGFASPVAVAWIYLRRQMRQFANQSGPGSPAWRRDRGVRGIGIVFLLVLTIGTIWLTLLFVR